MEILDDAAKRPELFVWRGAVPRTTLKEWMRTHKLDAPEDLVRFWQATGGGEAFETECLLSPGLEGEPSDEVSFVTREHRHRGMPSAYVVFHTGLGGLSAVSATDGEYVSFGEDSYEKMATFSSFDDWYRSFLRREYAERYGI